VTFHRTLIGLALLLSVAGCDEGEFGSTDSGEFACPDCNLVLISMDTLRADHVGTYGYPHTTTPAIDAWARNAIVFEQTYSTAPKTAESHMSIFTGLYPTVHQVFSVDNANYAPMNQISRLDERILTLPTILQKNGYRTIGFHGGGNVSGRFGFRRGFHRYERAEMEGSSGRKQIFGFVESMISQPDDKFFLFVHSYQVHAPYTPKATPRRTAGYRGQIQHSKAALSRLARTRPCRSPEACFWSLVDEESRADALHLEALYDGEIRELDSRIGALLQLLSHVERETLVVILGDHGEEFQEHGAFEHNLVYDEVLRVPLLIRPPHLKQGLRIPERVSLVDLLPTLLEMLEIEEERPLQGRSLLPLLAEGGRQEAIYSEYPPFSLYTLISGTKKLILRGRPSKDITDYQEVELYDLQSDPEEMQNLGESDDAFQRMFDRLVAKSFENLALRDAIQQGKEPETDTLDEETIEQLKALGYLE
jgi:arylsulfatase A-like enzyme